MRISRFFITAFVAVAVTIGAPAAFAQSDASVGSPMTPTENAPGRMFFNGQKFEQGSGVAIYENVCQGCHMPKAKGAAGAGIYPSLAQSPKLASAAYVTYMVLNGRNAMPPVGEALDDVQVAEVVNYVRSHFGNSYTDPVSPADVKAARPPSPAAAPSSH